MRLLTRSQVLRGLWVPWPTYGSRHLHPRNLLAQAFSRTEIPQWGDYDVPKEFNFASDVMDHWARMEKEGKRDPVPALWWVNDKGDEVKWNFQELGHLTRQAANVLTEICGLQRGDRLVLILPRIPDLWLVKVACMRAGLVFIPGTTQLTARDILYRLQLSKAKGIMTNETLAPAVDSVASDCPQLKTKLLVSENSRDGWLDFRTLLKAASVDHACVKTELQEPMTIFFTSGTTGLPKMVMHDGGLALRSCLPSTRQVMKLTSSDISWCAADPGWILSVVASMLEPWSSGACSFIHYLPQFNPETILKTLSRYPITCMVAAPSMYRMLLQLNISSYKFPALKHIVTGGETLLPEDFEKWQKATGLAIHEIYGQSETGLTCAVPRGMKIKKGSMGKVIPPFDMQIIDEKGNTLPPGTEGEMAVRIKPTRPVGVFSGYLDNPKKTSLSERGDFYVTGDRGTVDEDGYFWFIGRSDDIIKASGYRIGPSEVENALAEHPAVAESAVIGSPDPVRGEVVKAFVVLTPEFRDHDRDQLVQELQQHVKNVTAPYKYPRKVEFVSVLPKTITGKIKRSELRENDQRLNG
ncbi:acyl-coenzyme A synthetase ACSM1, mitochondrial-like [Trichosurus vulpecula]|uniref:acyl-coenzyme A synthetase ACSM1, mitochondrial-like n=1 Tax=Trichosurus vulpecula TaxID=9337 RepID=UPI00186B193E|nr:acyl-coenzyme A synthetase ACSM1, mitochondrial-like [Trichosurus vulpecula]XP_036597562.1 acyl-coenzyme A synthetase ACSM1, mitochondrial-like [Trichosurus vulpecula]XP_036597563.1 acyl-coenzyme A synthetase ACSM1, mitochondrial-like [Trichosurus vulpecula]XP_036597564.1 acyl-coenzyme A synthetase ACSM1, mitochondrial-like [Trichosurus vulpecula]